MRLIIVVVAVVLGVVIIMQGCLPAIGIPIRT